MKSKPKSGDSAQKRIRSGFIGLYLPPSLKAKIQQLAKVENRSLSNMCEVLINEAFELSSLDNRVRQFETKHLSPEEKLKVWGEKVSFTAQQASDS